MHGTDRRTLHLGVLAAQPFTQLGSTPAGVLLLELDDGLLDREGELSDIVDAGVRTQADPCVRPIFSMALFMSSTVTGFFGRPTIPLRDRMSRMAATTRKPCPDSMNSSRSPASMPNRSRTLFGRVTWPLLLRVADAIDDSLLFEVRIVATVPSGN